MSISHQWEAWRGVMCKMIQRIASAESAKSRDSPTTSESLTKMGVWFKKGANSEIRHWLDKKVPQWWEINDGSHGGVNG